MDFICIFTVLHMRTCKLIKFHTFRGNNLWREKSRGEFLVLLNNAKPSQDLNKPGHGTKDFPNISF